MVRQSNPEVTTRGRLAVQNPVFLSTLHPLLAELRKNSPEIQFQGSSLVCSIAEPDHLRLLMAANDPKQNKLTQVREDL